MNEPFLHDYRALHQRLLDIGAGSSAAELHGSLCGMLCTRGDALVEALPELNGDTELARALAAMRQHALQCLSEPGFDFMPLLPADDAPLPERVAALAAWCGGFGYGLAAREPLDFAALPADVREVVRDFTVISCAGVDEDWPLDDRAEQDYVELVEFVRVGVQLVFLELRGQASAPAARLH